MSARTVDGELSLRQSVIKQQCLLLRLPTLASQCGPLAEQAERERQPYLGYLEALLAAARTVPAPPPSAPPIAALPAAELEWQQEHPSSYASKRSNRHPADCPPSTGG
jgi:hypothetical protein